MTQYADLRPKKISVSFFSKAIKRLSSITSGDTWFNNFGLVISIFSLVLGFVTYALLSDNVTLSNRLGGFYWLLGVDVVLLLALAYAVGARAHDVWKKRKQQLAGAQLHIQLMTIFSALATVPAVLVAIFAVTFMQYGIQSWFGENIRTAVSESQDIAESYLIEHQQTIRADMLAMANDLNREAPRLMMNDNLLKEFFSTQAYLRNLSEAVLLDRSGKVIARAGISFSLELLPEKFSQMTIQADEGQVVLFMGENNDRVRALVKLDNYINSYLFVGRFVDEDVLARISATNRAASEYKNLQARQTELKLNMTLIFALVAVMLLLVAIWAGLTLAERIVSPVSRLINAAERVRQGDFNARVDIGQESEINTLARAFNRMTDQLGAQRRELVTANSELDERRRFIEAVLSGVNAGVIGMDKEGVIQVVNDSAQKLLALDLVAVIGKKLSEISPQMEKVRRVLRSKQGTNIEAPINVTVNGQSTESHWILRLSVERIGDEIKGYVATFDDLSPLIDAQRKAAWSDVARRVAHEIKNPLTPIQLAAERLKRRYAKLITDDRDTFEMCTDTIIRQVDDIRHMVDEFSVFARLPNTSRRNENLVIIFQQILVLFQQGNRNVSFLFEKPAKPVYLFIDRQQITQVLTNLIKNSIEAIAEQENNYELPKGEIALSLEEIEDHVILTVADNGPGWPKELLPRLTEPYVTTKDTGSGLGLAIVAKIIEDHNGLIELTENSPRGTITRITFTKGAVTHGE